MRQSVFSTLLVLLCLVVTAEGQNSRILQLAEQLEQNIGNLAERSSKEFVARTGNSRDELEKLLIAQQLKATAETFLLLVNSNRPGSELRDAADSFKDLAGKFSSNNPQWQQIKRDIDDLSREVKESNNNNGSRSDNDKEKSGNEKDKSKEVVGKLSWQGTVDDEVHLIINGRSVQVKTVSGTEYYDGIFNFTAPLPEENMRVFVNKKEGRGSVKVLQLPTSDNNFTAIIQVFDKGGGAKEYTLEIYWTK
jgi:hypothetical protein